MKALRAISFVLLLLAAGSALIGSGVAPAAYNLIENSGSALTRRTTLNFVNGGCVDNSGSGRTDCTVLTTVPSNATCPFTSVTTEVCSHGLGTTAVNVSVYDTSGVQIFPASVTLTSTNVVTVNFSTSQSGTVVVAGASGSGPAQFYQTIQQAGTPLAQEPVLNFPSNMTCTDNPGVATDCTPSGGGGSVPISGWTLQNAVNSDLTFNNFAGNAVAMSMQAINTADAGMATQAIPGSTYTVTATLNCIGPNVQLNSQLCGLGLFDGTKAETIEILQQSATIGVGVRVTTWSNLHSGTMTVLQGPTYAITGTQPTLMVHDDGTTRTWSYYENGGFVSFYSEASGTFLTPTAVGPLNFCDIAGIAGNPGYCTTQFLTWAATSP